jgi:hypothetical protein
LRNRLAPSHGDGEDEDGHDTPGAAGQEGRSPGDLRAPRA